MLFIKKKDKNVDLRYKKNMIFFGKAFNFRFFKSFLYYNYGKSFNLYKAFYDFISLSLFKFIEHCIINKV